MLDFHGACSFYRDAYPTIGRQRDLVVCRLGFFLSFSKACFGITLHCAPVSILKWMFSSFMFKFVNSSFLSFCDDSSSSRKRSLSVSVSDCFPDLVKLLVVRIWAFGEARGQNDFCFDIYGMWYRMLYILLVCGESHNDHMVFYSVSAVLVLGAVFIVEALFSDFVFGQG